MNAPFQVRQLAQYPREDAAIPGTVTLVQMGEAGAPYASILTSNFVTSALAGGGDLNLAAGLGRINFLFDQGAGAVTLSVVQGELQVSPALRTLTLDATFINTSGVVVNGDPVVTLSQLAADRAQSVTSFNLRTGDIMLMTEDILRAGGAPIRDAHFGGWITAPSVWDTRANDDTVATTNWVHRAIHDTGVSSFNGRTGCVVFTVADFNAATSAAPPGVYPTAPSPALGDASNRIATTLFVDESLQDLHLTISNEQLALLTSTYAPINSPQLTGIPTAPTAGPGTSTGQLATTSFVMHAITASTTGVSSFNTRTGAVLLNTADITSAGGAALASPAFSGNPTAPTAAPGTSNTQLATTAFVAAAVTAAGGVSSFNTRTGAVVLTLADVTGTNVLANTPLTGVPTAPTAAPGTSTTQLATTAFVAASAAAGVTSFMSRTGAITLSAADVSAAGGALNASPVFTGIPTAPTPSPGDNSTTLATTAFVTAALAATGVTTFNGRSGVVTLTGTDITNAGGALLASPTFTGTPAAPTATAGTNTTQLATTAFVQAALTGGGATPGWALTLVSTVSQLSATGTSGSRIYVTGDTSLTSTNQILDFRNQHGGLIAQVADTTNNSALTSANFLLLKNSVSGQPALLTVNGTDANRSIRLLPVGTGTVQAPTMTAGDNSTAVATTAFVHAAVAAPVVRSYLAGLTLSTPGGATNFTVAPGVACDSTNAFMINNPSNMAKTTSAWAAGSASGGLDTGTIANSTWYHVFLIYNPTIPVTDVLFSLSPSAPTMPSGYTLFRRIGAVRTGVSGNWYGFTQLGDEFLWSTAFSDVSAVAIGTASALYSLTVPTGVQVISRIRLTGSVATGGMLVLITSPDESAQVPGNAGGGVTLNVTSTGTAFPITLDVRTSTSGQIRGISSAAGTVSVNTYGWYDRRGRDA